MCGVVAGGSTPAPTLCRMVLQFLRRDVKSKATDHDAVGRIGEIHAQTQKKGPLGRIDRNKGTIGEDRPRSIQLSWIIEEHQG